MKRIKTSSTIALPVDRVARARLALEFVLAWFGEEIPIATQIKWKERDEKEKMEKKKQKKKEKKERKMRYRRWWRANILGKEEEEEEDEDEDDDDDDDDDNDHDHDGGDGKGRPFDPTDFGDVENLRVYVANL